LPLFGSTYYCPNIDCEFEKALKQGEKCPRCGAEAKPFSMRNGAALYASKKAMKKNVETENIGKGGYFCPNPKCTNVTELRQGEKCPLCGTEAQSDDDQEAQVLAKSKERRDNKGELLFTEATTDEELLKKIYIDMEHMSDLEKSYLGKLDTILSRTQTDQTLGAVLNALSEQNKIIILQNELILRNLNKKGV